MVIISLAIIPAAAHICAGLTEEQIKELFGSCGKVLSFRLVYDRETGRPKGFGFVEFPDSGSLLPKASQSSQS